MLEPFRYCLEREVLEGKVVRLGMGCPGRGEAKVSDV